MEAGEIGVGLNSVKPTGRNWVTQMRIAGTARRQRARHPFRGIIGIADRDPIQAVLRLGPPAALFAQGRIGFVGKNCIDIV